MALNLNDFRADAAKLVGVTTGPQPGARDAGGGDVHAAEEALRTAVRLCPWQPAYQADLAGLCMARASQAAPPARQPMTAECRRWMAEAEQCLQHAIALEPEDYRSYLSLGQLYAAWAVYEPECIARGVRAYQQAAAATPGRQHVYWAWGEFYLAIGQPAAAVERYQYAVSLDPSVISAHQMLAELYLRLQQPQPAEREYERAWTLEVRSKPAGATCDRFWFVRAEEHLNLAESFAHAQDRTRALHHLRQSLAINAFDGRALKLLAKLGGSSSLRARVEG